MIRLIVNPDKQPHLMTFDKEVIIIGSAQDADLVLKGEKLEKAHVKIERQANNYLIFNQANDPFVTLNGLPFGKKILKSEDLIQIGNTQIRFSFDLPKPPVEHLVTKQFSDTG